jgi:acetolactate synthase-1/2/3 large subunit
MNDVAHTSDVHTGGDAVCAALEALGVRTIFGIPSQQNLALYDALRRSGRIRMIGARHEAGAVHAADGYARATGELGVAIVSTGPGTANAVNGLYEAGFASSPVLLITTQVDRVHLGRGRSFIHDADGQSQMLRSVTRRTECVMHGHRIADTIMSVAADILSGRPQPGAVEIPTDLLSAPTTSGLLRMGEQVRIAPNEALIERAAALLDGAKRPLLWLGGGSVSAEAAEAVRSLVERLGIPVVSSLNGRGCVPTDHPLFIGSQTHYPAFRPLLEQADAVLAIGTRFQAVATWFWSLPMPAKLIQVDVDPTAIGRNFPVEIGIVGDARLAVESLSRKIRGGVIDSDFLRLAGSVRAELAADTGQRIGPDHTGLCDAIARHAPKERVVVCDATMTGTTWGSQRLPADRPRQFMYSTSLAIGPALPLGVGAAVGSGKRTIVMHGDGGIMLSLGELATAVEAAAPVTVLVFNNQGYGGLKYLQTAYGIPHVGVDLHTPDFVGFGTAMGLPSWRVDNVADFEAVFASAMAGDGPNLIEVDITTMVPLEL